MDTNEALLRVGTTKKSIELSTLKIADKLGIRHKVFRKDLLQFLQLSDDAKLVKLAEQLVSQGWCNIDSKPVWQMMTTNEHYTFKEACVVSNIYRRLAGGNDELLPESFKQAFSKWVEQLFMTSQEHSHSEILRNALEAVQVVICMHKEDIKKLELDRECYETTIKTLLDRLANKDEVINQLESSLDEYYELEA